MISLLLPLYFSTALSGNPVSFLGSYRPLLYKDFPPYPFLDRLGTPLARYPSDLQALDDGFLNFYYHPLANIALKSDNEGPSCASLSEDTFTVKVNVQKFKPEEVEVKVEDGYVVISAKHDEKVDEHGDGLVTRQLLYKYLIPENVDGEKVNSSVSSDGVLTVQAPVKAATESKDEGQKKKQKDKEESAKPMSQEEENENKEESAKPVGQEKEKQNQEESVKSTSQEKDVENKQESVKPANQEKEEDKK